MIAEPMIAEPMIAEPDVVEVPAQIVEPDVVEVPAQIVEPDVGADVVAGPAIEVGPAQIAEPEQAVEVGPEVVAEPAMVAEPVVVVGPAVYDVGNDPDIVLMEVQEPQPVDLADSDIEILDEVENPRQRLMHIQMRQRQMWHRKKSRHQRRGRRY